MTRDFITGNKYNKKDIFIWEKEKIDENYENILEKDFFEIKKDDLAERKLNIYWDQQKKENQSAWDLLIVDNLKSSGNSIIF